MGRIRNFLRWTVLVATAYGLVQSTIALAPPAYDVAAALYGDPIALTSFRLRRLTPEDYDRSIRAALAPGENGRADPALAASFLALADQRRVSIDPGLRAEVEAAQGIDFVALASDGFAGAVYGDISTGAGLAATVVSDFMVIGDVRDLTKQGYAYATGAEYDGLILALAIGGLVAEAGTIATVGGGTPVKLGISLLKAAKKAGRLTGKLAANLSGVSSRLLRSIDASDMQAALGRAARLDFDGAGKTFRRSVDARALDELLAAGQDFGTMTRRQGLRASSEALQLADTTADLKTLNRVSTHYGEGFQAVVKIAKGSGRAIWRVADMIWSLAGWLFALAGWVLSALWWMVLVARGVVRTTVRVVAYA